MNDENIIKVGVIIGSTRQGRFGDKPAKWILERVSASDGMNAELLDLRDYPMPFFDEPLPPMAGEAYENEVVKRWAAKIGEMDAFIIVSPEYNHGYSAVVKNALDYLYREWNDKPVGFVGWGSAGGSRAVEQLRQVVIELQMIPISRGVHITGTRGLIDEDGNLKADAFDAFERAAEGMIGQLGEKGRLLKKSRSV